MSLQDIEAAPDSKSEKDLAVRTEIIDFEQPNKNINPSDPSRLQDERLRRQLKSRHGSMIAIGGAIGTGLILTSGTGLARAGPVGLLIAFIYIGSLCYGMMTVSCRVTP